MPPSARISDMHTCPKVEPGPVPHVGGPTSSGASTVIIGGMPAARVGDMLVCCGPPDSISQGEATVIIAGKPAARQGDPTSHGGVLVAGCPTVLIGSSTQAFTIEVAAQTGTPFCEECQRAVNRASSGPAEIKPHGARFRAIDQQSGEPTAGLPYRIEKPDGTVVVGVTDKEGMTVEITTAAPELLQFYWDLQDEKDAEATSTQEIN